jgi:hypothetical protein
LPLPSDPPSDAERLRTIARNIAGFWAPIAHGTPLLNGCDDAAVNDCASLLEIANRLEKKQ